MAELGKVLIVGGTGMLAEASRWLARRADQTWLLARKPEVLAAEVGAIPAPLDWQDPAAEAVITALPQVDTALIWLHDAATHLARPFEDRLGPKGRSIRIHGRNSLDPAVRAKRDPNPRPDIRRQVVILSRVGKRWLTDAEISAGAIEAAQDPSRTVLIVGDAS